MAAPWPLARSYGADMQIKAEIVIEIEAADFIEAADHQRLVQDIHRTVQASYPQAALHLRERRERPKSNTGKPPVLPASRRHELRREAPVYEEL